MDIFSINHVELRTDSLGKRLRGAERDLVERLVASARDVLEPRAAFRASYVDEKAEDAVVIDGLLFRSRVLRHNLEGIGRVFPFVLTVGEALDRIIDRTSDVFEGYLLDEIGNLALAEARRHFEHHLRRTFALKNISSMSPDCLQDWPLEEQRTLFPLLSGVESALGVRLTESLLMLPRKSVSGIYFAAEVSFLPASSVPVSVATTVRPVTTRPRRATTAC